MTLKKVLLTSFLSIFLIGCGQSEVETTSSNESTIEEDEPAIESKVEPSTDTSELLIEKDGALYIVPEDLTLELEDGFEIYSNTIVLFGPMAPSFGPIASDDVYAYQIELLEPRTLEDIEEALDFTTKGPGTRQIADYQVVEWSAGGFCDSRYLEIIGNQKNIQLGSSGCAFSEEGDYAYFENVIQSIGSPAKDDQAYVFYDPIESPDLSNIICLENFEEKPIGTINGYARNALSKNDLDSFLSLMKINSLCIPETFGAPFLYADWDVETESADSGRKFAISLENTMDHGSAWGGHIEYATYDVSTGTESSNWASQQDYEKLKDGSIENTVQINGFDAMVEYRPFISLDGEEGGIQKAVTLPFSDHYISFVYPLPNSEGDFDAFMSKLEDKQYPDEYENELKSFDAFVNSVEFNTVQ